VLGIVQNQLNNVEAMKRAATLMKSGRLSSKQMRTIAKRMSDLTWKTATLTFRRWTGRILDVKFFAPRTVLIGLFIYTFLLAPCTATAGPFKNFFRKVRHAFAKPARRSSAYQTVHKDGGAYSSAERVAPTAGVHASPNERNTRTARRSVANGRGKIDIPYGTPVPGKQGFVTSPFSPDSGYVDVRGVPPGTEVKDPYSGKTFLTP
jgi:hypothetical protein